MTNRHRAVVAGLALSVFGPIGGGAAPDDAVSPPAPAAPAAAPPSEERRTLEKIYEAGAAALVARQQPDGSWVAWEQHHVGFTGLAVTALAGAPEPFRSKYTGAVGKAVTFLLSRQHPDGSFVNPDGILRNYNTCIAVMALAAVDPKAYAAPIKKAQEWILNFQAGGGLPDGGYGYGDLKKTASGNTKKNAQADLNNTNYALEALKASGLPADSEAYKRALSFITRCQNFSETNNDPELLKALKAMDEDLRPGNDGSFYYAPTETKATELDKNADGSKSLRGYGSMTYAGIKMMIYAGVTKDDPRVRAAVYWIGKHYTLDENPGLRTDARPELGLQGLYYYYQCFAKALDVLGEPTIKTADGKVHEWPRDLLARLASVQNEGMWVNKNDRWEEGDQSLVTSYVLMTLNTLSRWIK